MSLPVYAKAIIVACIALLGVWMIIDPIYLELQSLIKIPIWGWMLAGFLLIIFAAKFGKAVI